ncbi:MAG: phenylalanine--tRNA ligase subunit beta, partial [Chloroflexota bacterium]|nr:phenylalanine--tRNA ligase subunit beta [Chloroflexota bacterium]
MRVPLSWLRDYVDVELSPRDLADELTIRGMETTVETAGADWTDVVVGRVLEVGRHPNADTLWLTKVDVGADAPLEIVCGAQNLEVGQLVPTAVVGAVLPGDRRIERSKIRGVVSNGMLCSAVELGIGSDADGIHILGRDDQIALGTPLAEVVGETVLDVDVKPNRGDALSMVGLAREIAAFTGGTLRMPSVEVDETDEPADTRVSVRIEEPELNPRFTARWFDGVANGDSPAWMQQRLVAAGMRPISAVVDVTNYVMHELGQPMHAYDADAVPGGEIVVRRARDGETLITIDHVERRLDERMLVIADRERAIGLAGIMGGASTEVTESTTRVILESAIFHGPTIRATARRLGLRSEASMRHEKGIGHDLPRLAADRAAQLIAEITGARVARGIVDNDPEPKEPVRVPVSVARMSHLLGIDLDASTVRALLTPLGFEVTGEGDALAVAVPPHRLDVSVPADVAEEVARAYGYERIAGRLPQAALPPYRPDPSAGRNRIRRILAGMGIDEAVGHALIGADDLARTRLDPEAAHLVRIYNPLSPEHAIMRPSMAPTLLGELAENARRRRPDAWIFDLGKVYWHRVGAPEPRDTAAETAGTGWYESWELGIILSGPATPAGPGEAATPADAASI